MPGLVGIVNTRGDRVNQDLMQAMRRAIQHREWYETDNYVSPTGSVSISRVHLGFLDQGGQPYAAGGGHVKVFLHGQIYNDQVAHMEPAEFAFRLYEKKGLDFAAFLNGSFVIAIVDEQEESVIIATDRLATRPLFYLDAGSAVYFSPEMKSLLQVAGLERRLNLAALADFLANGFLSVEHTLIAGIQRLENATVLRLTRQGVVHHRYWQPSFGPAKDLGLDHYQQTLEGLLRQAVRRSLGYPNTYGVLLSGGYDSRGILGFYLQETSDQHPHTISWGIEEDTPASDCWVARRLAHKLGTQHRFYARPAEEVLEDFNNFVWMGEAQTEEAASYRVFDRIREEHGVKIILRGDEPFGHRLRLVYDEDSLFRSFGFRVLSEVDAYRRVLKPDYYRTLSELDVQTRRYLISKCTLTQLRDRADFYCFNPQLTYILNPYNYIKTFALESLTPLLDHDLIDFMGTLPVKYRLDKMLYRHTIVALFPELFAEFARSGNAINWANTFKSWPDLRRFAYRQLVETQHMLDEFIDKESLKRELDAFFAAPVQPGQQHGLNARLKRSIDQVLDKSQAARDLVHRAAYSIRKRTGRSTPSLPPEKFVMRLLILKVWGDLFMNYPATPASETGSPELVSGAQPAYTPLPSAGSKL
jgi:asparagine synthetase B (glutamine-hydrolysing)